MGDPYSDVTVENFNQNPPPDPRMRETGDSMTDDLQHLKMQLAEQQELTRQVALQRDHANNELARARTQIAVREQIITALRQQMPLEETEAAPAVTPRAKKKPANGAEKAASA